MKEISCSEASSVTTRLNVAPSSMERQITRTDAETGGSASPHTPATATQAQPGAVAGRAANPAKVTVVAAADASRIVVWPSRSISRPMSGALMAIPSAQAPLATPARA